MRWIRRSWWRSEDGRRFAREIGGIVLGVLIALAIGEVADAVRWRVRVNQAKAAMRTELSGNRFNVVERQMASRCIARRLADIGAVLQAARRTGNLPPIAAIGQPSFRIVETAAFEVATGEGTLRHMDRGDARDVAILYTLAAVYWNESTAAERDEWATLRMLQQPGGAVDGNILATLAQAHARALQASESVEGLAGVSDRMLQKNGIPVEWGEFGSRAGLARSVSGRPICAPLVAPLP